MLAASLVMAAILYVIEASHPPLFAIGGARRVVLAILIGIGLAAYAGAGQVFGAFDGRVALAWVFRANRGGAVAGE